MSSTTIFYQACPVCGRSLRVPVKFFGRPMSCSHCHGEFVAGEDQVARHEEDQTELSLPAALLLSPVFAPPQLGEV
jgi:hypothetical protein